MYGNLHTATIARDDPRVGVGLLSNTSTYAGSKWDEIWRDGGAPPWIIFEWLATVLVVAVVASGQDQTSCSVSGLSWTLGHNNTGPTTSPPHPVALTRSHVI